ncbi:MAG: 1-acyl-sn-glycerol-3-phosphate acyltransferase [Deltaproteobacteria bacterium]|nr:MAG: 1-acyl-sn-glycerol-3-phosphate acyltransferase [Deltaproteobacteria bacterium]
MPRTRSNFTLAFGLWFHFWLIIVTIIGCSLTILFSFLDRSGRMVHRIARGWGQALLYFGRILAQVEGVEHLVPGQTYVFAANHRSNFDIYLLLALLPGEFAFVAKKSLFKIPLFGKALDRMGCIPVDRENIQQAIRSLNQAAARISRGNSIAIFPEGTRTLSPKLIPFKKGVFIMAQRSGQPVVPVAINGTRFIQPRGTIRVQPGPVKMVIRPPLFPQNFRRKEQLMAAVHDSIAAAYDPDFPYGPGTLD